MSITSKINQIFFLLAMSIMLSACGGGASTEGKQSGEGGSAVAAVISDDAPIDVVNYKKFVWDKLSEPNRCAQCHNAGGQAPQFVHNTSVATAHAESLTFRNGVQVANKASPADSLMVTIVANGHQPQACWRATNAECADDIEQYITDWSFASNVSTVETKGVKLVAPSPLRSVDESKTFPSDSSDFESLVHTPVLTQYCVNCHTPTAASPRSPFFASNDVAASYLFAQPRMDLLDPSNSQFVLKLRDQSHNCWSGDCEADATTMQNAITAFADTIDATDIDADLIVSKAMRLQPPEAIIASGGERHVSNQIALWEFKNEGDDPNASTAYDTSGISPLMPLTIVGNKTWVGGYGLKFESDGFAFASYENSRKLRNNIVSGGSYSIEAWVIPSNVTQVNKHIISYTGGPTARNFTISQNLYNYRLQNLSNESADANGTMVSTQDASEDLQATQQHIVMTFDPVRGGRIYVNGEQTDHDPDPDGNNGTDATLTDWRDTFNFVLANELGVSGSARAWDGTFRMVAIHNAVLTDAQIDQNFKAGVGEKFFLLFSISHIPGVPADSYIKVQAEQFDTYSYLFNNPVYVNLADPTPVIDFAIGGMRIGINGKEAIVGQSFVNLETDRITSNDQEISRLGSVIQLQQGTIIDDFFLSFETLGDLTNPFVFATPGTPAEPADLPAQSDIGVRTFSEVNATMSEITGIPTSNTAVFTVYTNLIQQLPSTENITSFVPANIIGISQLAFEYCDQLVADTEGNRDAYFNDAILGNFDFASNVSTAFNVSADTATEPSPEKKQIVNALYDRMLGIPDVSDNILKTAPTRESIMTELVDPDNSHSGAQTVPPSLENLFDRMSRSCGADDPDNDQVECSSDKGTKEFVKAMCTSVLGSAAMLVQ